MNRGLTAFVIASGFITTLIVIGAPLLRLASSTDRARNTSSDYRLAQAREFFDTFAQLDKQRDLEILNMYSDTAIVIDRRPSPNGRMTDLKIPIVAFKPMLKGLFTVANAADDPPTVYREIKQYVEGDGIRIESDGYSPSEEFQRHLSMLILPAGENAWRIEELIVESPEVRR
jgi:hypothetical protein